ncbi:MAG: enoyl-CoA hydratase/isomerase family protein [Deltaproteobacteria bacterium]|nr:enoyl-CoA hydratase/isomerase family protein [Deltaproteobacteria bacterium]MBW2071789.1 enoyl-CoA hydratase/isomerase family protein [Deltaproteobacteria bacterium]
MTTQTDPSVFVLRGKTMVKIVLNRPRVLNSLNLEMIRLIQQCLDEVEEDASLQFVVFSGAGEKGFCAGGDIKALAQAIVDKKVMRPDLILQEEYDLCLRLHHFPKPVVVLADGITMGAGLGLAAGADIVLATDRTRMAMPETRIGFFPDVGATGWMFEKCPAGYPEYLGLTGYEMVGAEAVRVGFATHLVRGGNLDQCLELLRDYTAPLPPERPPGARLLADALEPFLEPHIPAKAEMDEWVASYFAGAHSVVEMLTSLRQCSIQTPLCEGVFFRLSERSPTALVLTLKLLRHNEGRPIEEVLQADLEAARFMFAHHDYFEGVRARLIDKDDQPKWQPATIEEVGPLKLEL